MRVCVFGGSFNPLHNGHIALARAVIEKQLADEVWLMISPHNPLKEETDLLPEQLRFEIACAGIAGIPGLRVSDFEFHLPRPSFTWKTLDALKTAYPDVEFSLLIGGDNWSAFHLWARHDYILENYAIIVYPRTGETIVPDELPSNVCLIEAPLLLYSSTQIRERLSRGEDISQFVPESELEYIEKCQLNAFFSLKK